VLTTRDVLRLQALAARCIIVIVYGTTVTQHAVSYFALPPAAQDTRFLAT
jgi:L-aminoadipate-semialdehyde dehydrogenase